MPNRTKTPNQRTWERHVVAWRKSGQSQREFCKARGLKLTTFRNYTRRFPVKSEHPSRRRRAPKSTPAKTFAPVKITDAPSISGTYELDLGGGRRLRVPIDCDVEHVAALVAALGSATC